MNNYDSFIMMINQAYMASHFIWTE